MIEDELAQTIKKLQQKIDYDEEQIYSKTVIREYRNPINFGALEHPDANGIIKGPCGDTMRITLKIAQGKIQNARFWTDGCGASLAAGNMLTKMVIGKNLKETKIITSQQLLEALDGLPKEHSHCAHLAINTLQEVINNYENKRK